MLSDLLAAAGLFSSQSVLRFLSPSRSWWGKREIGGRSYGIANRTAVPPLTVSRRSYARYLIAQLCCSLPRSTLRWSSWASAESWSVISSLGPHLAADRSCITPETCLPFSSQFILLCTPLENKRSVYIYPLHLSPLFSSSCHSFVSPSFNSS